MMNLLDHALNECRSSGRTALIPFVAAGDPDLDFTMEQIQILADAGATAIEIGFPFSDPVADGPVIQAAYTRSLNAGFQIDHLFQRLKRHTSKVPLIGMASYSLIWRKGLLAFLDAAIDAGLCGVVVPDLPVEEANEFATLCKQRDFKLILLVTPTTAPERAEAIVKCCTGFVYVVSVVGITGQSASPSTTLPDLLKRLRNLTSLPLCVGFGISTPSHLTALRPLADGAIVGTALVRLTENANRQDALNSVNQLAMSLAAACQPQ